MPKSKRDKDVSLTKVTKKGKALKEKLVDEIRRCVDTYERVFVFSIDSARNTNIQELRMNFRDSRYFFGRNRVMALALGRIVEDEYKDNLHKVSRKLNGQCSLMFTNRPEDEIINFFANYKVPDYARSGNVANQVIEFEGGPLEYIPHSMEPFLRKLGLPVALEKGVVVLTTPHVVCNEGDKLTPEQAKILKIFHIKLTEFRATVSCVWSKDGKFKSLGKKSKRTAEPSSTAEKPKRKKKNKENTATMDVDV